MDTPAVESVGLEKPGLTLAAGDRVGPYTIVDVLGEGGFSMVYGAEQHEPLRRSVARPFSSRSESSSASR